MFAIGASILAFSISSSGNSTETCPPYPLGVSSQQDNDGKTYYASAFVRPFSEDEEALIEAYQEARLVSRILFQRDKRVPLGANGRLVGAKDEGSCVADGRVYFSVSINLKSAAQAIALSEQLRKSIAKTTTSQIPSYSWTADGNQQAEIAEIRDLLKR